MRAMTLIFCYSSSHQYKSLHFLLILLLNINLHKAIFKKTNLLIFIRQMNGSILNYFYNVTDVGIVDIELNFFVTILSEMLF